MKKIKYLLLFVMILLTNSNIVLANTNDNIIDFNKLGTITITLKESNNNISIKGAELTIYKIASATSIDNNLEYIFNDNIKKCNLDLSDISDNNLANKIDKCIENLELEDITKTTNEEGIVIFDNLQLGLYLVKQTNNVEGYSNIDPFLVAIPTLENNIWIYNIEATPKTDIIRLMDIIVEKKWDIINGNNTPNKVLVQLLKKDEVIDTIILNNENNWTYTWKQIEASDEYSVKEIEIPAGYTATYRTVDNKFIITNTKTLVQTGQNILLIQVLVSIGLIFIITGLIINKRNNYE